MTANENNARSGRVWKGALIAVSGFLMVLLIAAIYASHNANALKPLLSSLSERYLERSLDIDGELSLELSMQPRITAHKVTFGNSAGASAPQMAKADYLQFQIDLADLWERKVRLMHLHIRDAVLNLEDSVEGQPNWVLFKPAADDADRTPWSFVLEGLNLERGRIHATIGELAPMDLTIPTLVEQSRPDGHLHLDGHGKLNNNDWVLDGQVGPFAELISGGRIELDLALTLNDARTSANGRIDNLATLSGLNLNLTMKGPDADVLGEIFRMPEAFAGDIALDATIRPDHDAHEVIINGHISTFKVETRATVADLKSLDGLDGSFSVEGPDAQVFGKALQIEGFPDGPFRIEGAAHLQGGDFDLKEVQITTADLKALVNADFVDFPHRQGASAAIDLSGPDLGQFQSLLPLAVLPNAPFDLKIALDAAGATTARGTEALTASLNVGTHVLTAAGPVGEYPDFAGTRLALGASGGDFAEILEAAGLTRTLQGAYHANGTMTLDNDGLRLDRVDAALPPFRFEGALHWPELSRLAACSIEGTLDVSDLAQAAAPFTDVALPAEPLKLRAQIRAHDGGFEVGSSELTLPDLSATASGNLTSLTELPGLDLNLAVNGASIDALFPAALPADGETTPFTLEGGIRGVEEGIQLTDLTLKTRGGTFTADGLISLGDGFAASHLQLRGSGATLSELIPAFPDYKPPDLPWEIDAKITLPQAAHLGVSDGHLKVGSIKVSLSGILDSADQTQTDLSIHAQGDRISDIGQIGNIPWPDHAFNINTELEGSLNTITVKKLESHWGASDLSGSGRLELDGKPFLSMKGRSRVLNIIDLQHAIFGEREDLEPEDDRARVFPDTPIPTSFLAVLDAKLDIQVDQFQGQRTHMRDIHLNLDIKDGQLLLERAAYSDDIGSFDGKGHLRPDGDSAYLELKVNAENAVLKLFTTPTQDVDTIPQYSVKVDVSGRGKTVAELIGHLNGTLLISSDGGQINNAVMNALGGDFVSNVLEILNPFVTTSEYTAMQCMVLNAAINDGQLKLAPGFVMRTDQLNMFVYGKVNLATEKLDLSLATQANRGIGISAATITNPYFKVGGTLATPALQLDPASAAVAASVATATAGISILVRGILDRLRGTQNPCPQFLEYKQPAQTQTQTR